jgi:hypothetical protein
VIDPNQCPDDELTLLNTYQYKLLLPSIGAGYKVNSFELSGYYMHYLPESYSKDGRSFDFPGGAVTFTAAYKFK